MERRHRGSFHDLIAEGNGAREILTRISQTLVSDTCGIRAMRLRRDVSHPNRELVEANRFAASGATATIRRSLGFSCERTRTQVEQHLAVVERQTIGYHPRMKNLALVFLLMVIMLGTAAQPVIAATPESGQTFETGGVTIWYEVRGAGSGTPLFIVNGGPGFDHAYTHLGDPVWDTFEKSRRVVFYDQRGNGRSSELKPGQTCTLADQIADLDALRNQLGLDKIDLLGHSWGGYLVMAYSARHPEHIRHLVIVDSAAPKFSDTKFLFNDIFPETTEKQDALSFADTLGDKKAGADSMALYMTMLFYSPEKRAAALPIMAKADFHKAVNESISADIGRFDLNPEIAKFNFPTLVVTGRYDINVAPSVAWKIHKAIPASRFTVFERSGHIPYFEEPEAFGMTLEEFLKQ